MANEEITKWEDYGEDQAPKVKVRGYEEIPSFDDYANTDYGYSDEVDPAVENGINLAKPLRALGYGVRKYATDPIYKGVDVVAQKGGNKIAELLGANIKDEDRYADVDFGKNGEKQGYESLDEYLAAKAKADRDYARYRKNFDDPNAWYSDANYDTDYTEEPTYDPDSEFASLTGTKAYQDWQPDTMVGKVAKGASGIAGDMLPSNLEGYAIEKAPQLVMGALAPFYQKMKTEKEAINGVRKQAPSDLVDQIDRNFRNDMGQMKEALKTERHRRYDASHADNLTKNLYADRLEKLKSELTPDQYQKLLQSGDIEFQPAIKNPQGSRFLSEIKAEREAALNDPATVKSIARNARGGQPKPLPNPAAQRAEAMARNARPTADLEDAMWRAKNIARDYGYEGESINTALENAIAKRLANLTAEEISNYSLRPNTTDTAIYVANKAIEDLMDSGVIR